MNAWAASRRPSCNLSAAVSCVFSECCNVSRLYRSHSSTHLAVPDTPFPTRAPCLDVSAANLKRPRTATHQNIIHAHISRMRSHTVLSMALHVRRAHRQHPRRVGRGVRQTCRAGESRPPRARRRRSIHRQHARARATERRDTGDVPRSFRGYRFEISRCKFWQLGRVCMRYEMKSVPFCSTKSR